MIIKDTFHASHKSIPSKMEDGQLRLGVRSIDIRDSEGRMIFSVSISDNGISATVWSSKIEVDIIDEI